MAGNLIGPELSPMRRSRPAVARRLSIRAPAPAPAPPANRISSRRHCVPATLKRIRFSRCENDAFLPRARPARPAAAASRGAAHRPTRSRPSHYTFTTLPLRRPPQTEPDHRHYSDRSGAPPVACHNKMVIFNNCRQIPDPPLEELLNFHAAFRIGNYLFVTSR